MIQLRFQNKMEHATAKQFEAPFFRITPTRILRGPTDQLIAELRDGLWDAGDRFYSTLEIATPVKIHFEDAAGHCSAEQGPFEQLKVIDGVIWRRPGVNELLAWLRADQQAWHVYAEHRDWSMAIVTESAPAA